MKMAKRMEKYLQRHGMGRHSLENMGHASDCFGETRLDYFMCSECGRLFTHFSTTGAVKEITGKDALEKKEHLLKMAKDWGYEKPWMNIGEIL